MKKITFMKKDNDLANFTNFCNNLEKNYGTDNNVNKIDYVTKQLQEKKYNLNELRQLRAQGHSNFYSIFDSFNLNNISVLIVLSTFLLQVVGVLNSDHNSDNIQSQVLRVPSLDIINFIYLIIVVVYILYFCYVSITIKNVSLWKNYVLEVLDSEIEIKIKKLQKDSVPVETSNECKRKKQLRMRMPIIQHTLPNKAKSSIRRLEKRNRKIEHKGTLKIIFNVSYFFLLKYSASNCVYTHKNDPPYSLQQIPIIPLQIVSIRSNSTFIAKM